LVFYGGEPLLQLDRIKELIDGLNDIKNIQFRMQTNGKLLDHLEMKYLNKIGKILVSIDGTKERTDFNKCNGTYAKVIRNLKKIRKEGYNGEIVARMCVSEKSDIYKQIMHLKKLIEEGLFDSIHWQLDVGFYSCDYDYKKVKNFLVEYNEEITKLVSWWINEMKKGTVWKLYPFLGICENLLINGKTQLMCGAGHSGYTITTDGNLVACPIMGCMPDFYCGDLESDPKTLKKIHVGGRCENCEYLGNCGGRCLYVNSVGLWPEEGLDLVCESVKHLIDDLKFHLTEIKLLIEKGVISEKDFFYEKYFGPEIVP
jgi:putative peptide-modifying radical SAM enzyme